MRWRAFLRAWLSLMGVIVMIVSALALVVAGTSVLMNASVGVGPLAQSIALGVTLVMAGLGLGAAVIVAASGV